MKVHPTRTTVCTSREQEVAALPHWNPIEWELPHERRREIRENWGGGR
jgi:hypothetical protein